VSTWAAPQESAPGAVPPDLVQLQPAGIVSRFIAALVDLVVIILIVGAIYIITAGAAFLVNPRSFTWPDSVGWTIPLVGGVVAMPYLALSWCTGGRTVGDGLLGLRVLNHTRQRVRFPVAVVRALFCLVFPLGLLWIPFSRWRHSVQDVVLRTVVVYDWDLHRQLQTSQR
jgi:uncharacterized RDD family membrane protein YckC